MHELSLGESKMKMRKKIYHKVLLLNLQKNFLKQLINLMVQNFLQLKIELNLQLHFWLLWLL